MTTQLYLMRYMLKATTLGSSLITNLQLLSVKDAEEHYCQQLYLT